MKWEPIETAPKGGLEVLVWTPNDGPFVGFYSRHGRWMWTTHPLGGDQFIDPTPWMPLPDPPE